GSYDVQEAVREERRRASTAPAADPRARRQAPPPVHWRMASASEPRADDSTPGPAPRSGLGAWGAALVALAALAAYHDALPCGFVLDDYHYILENRGLTVAAVPRLFVRAYVSAGNEFYRPLATATFALDRRLFGVWAPGFHAHNLLWHVAASLAL